MSNPATQQTAEHPCDCHRCQAPRQTKTAKDLPPIWDHLAKQKPPRQ